MNFQKFLDVHIGPIATDIQLAVEQSPMQPNLFISVEQATKLTNAGYFEVENGYCLNPDGSACISALTDMPGVTPDMWHWWFGWHGDDSEKYKLWHPKAHISAEWKDQIVGEIGYIGRVSCIREYIGQASTGVAIQFIKPSSIGLPNFAPQASDAVYIVARIGLLKPLIDIGWLIHQVRKTDTGSEMRSRFWLGGKHISGRNGLGNLLSSLARRIRTTSEEQASNVMIHCAEEMTHLAKFLPELYATFNE